MGAMLEGVFLLLGELIAATDTATGMNRVRAGHHFEVRRAVTLDVWLNSGADSRSMFRTTLRRGSQTRIQREPPADDSECVIEVESSEILEASGRRVAHDLQYLAIVPLAVLRSHFHSMPR